MRTRPSQLSLLDLERRQEPRKSDAERIGDIAARVVEELDQQPPIDLSMVASFRDIAKIEVVPMVQAGSLAPSDDGFLMSLRSSDSPRRRRFTGFHEVGHTFQPGYFEQTLFRCAEPSIARRVADDPEALADIAASELLLPRAFFAADAIGSDFSLSSVAELADAYQASVQATSYRFAALRPEAILVLVLEPGLRKEERDDPKAVPKLRVVSAWPCPHGAWPYVPPNKSAEPDGALVRALHGELVDEKAGLEDLGLEGLENTELTARLFSYHDGTEPRERVVALFRRVGNSRG